MSLFEHELKGLRLSEALEQSVHQWLGELRRNHPALCRDIVRTDMAASFVRCAASSPFFTQICSSRGHLVRALVPYLKNPDSRLSEYVKELVTNDTNASRDVIADIRQCREITLAGIMWRDFGLLCACETTLTDLSCLADAMILLAVEYGASKVSELFGRPDDDRLGVIAMGKLGGNELNLSSDVDLIFIHSGVGQSEVVDTVVDTQADTQVRARSVDHHEYFSRQVRFVVDALSRATPDGQGYRVDTRLRPFGRSGRAVTSLNALEHYLTLYGREWERYAYIKHRLITPGDRQRFALAQLLKPFVYRRYLDFGVIAGLREMKSKIDAEVKRKELGADIKRGRGGIRTLEFIVQTQQLIYGGKNLRLQTPSFYQALNELSDNGLLSTRVGHVMRQDYDFLRRVENGLQGMYDKQTHELPTTAIDQERLVLLMGADSWSDLERHIDDVRTRVQQRFDELTFVPNSKVSVAVSQAGSWWQRAIGFLEEADVKGQPALQPLISLAGDSLRERLDQVGRERLDALMPTVLDIVLDEVSGSANEAELGLRLARVFEGIGRRSAYFSLLNENHHGLKRLFSICRHSSRLARQVALYPMLLDTLVDPRGSSFELDESGLRQRCRNVFEQLRPEDEESYLQALREFQQIAIFDVAVADLENQLSVMKVSDRLTLIAELVVRQALEYVSARMAMRYGKPRCKHSNDEARFAVVGYGKLGGLEMSYGSDLDLVFLYDDGGDGRSDGQDAIDNKRYFSKLSQRFISTLAMQTAFGTLYDVDMRLRPSGRSGLLVSRLPAFSAYQRQRAWTWEHQALLRARAIAGSANLMQSFEQLRLDVVKNCVNRGTLREQVCTMRMKMKSNLDLSDRDTIDLKQADGGLVDIEFLVQYLLLKYAETHPEIIKFSDNVRQLEGLAAAGVLAGEAEEIKQIYLAYREKLHRQVLNEQSAQVARGDFNAERQYIGSLLSRYDLWTTVDSI